MPEAESGRVSRAEELRDRKWHYTQSEICICTFRPS